MPKTRGTGLLMVWTDIAPEHEAGFNRWYDEEHIHRLLRIPGVLSAGRYVALCGGPKYLALYELEDHHVMKSSAFIDEVRYRPSADRQRLSGGHAGSNYLLNLYRQIFPARTNPAEATMGRRRYCKWAASTCRPPTRRNSTIGTTPRIYRHIYASPACCAPAASL